mgnify:CR=1 FL=1
MGRKRKKFWGKSTRSGEPYYLGTLLACRCHKRCSYCRRQCERSWRTGAKRRSGLHTRWTNWQDYEPKDMPFLHRAITLILQTEEVWEHGDDKEDDFGIGLMQVTMPHVAIKRVAKESPS